MVEFEEYGENGAVPLWLDQAAVAVAYSDWERPEGMLYETEHQLQDVEKWALLLVATGTGESSSSSRDEEQKATQATAGKT